MVSDVSLFISKRLGYRLHVYRGPGCAVCVCVCVLSHTHTHTAHQEMSFHPDKATHTHARFVCFRIHV